MRNTIQQKHTGYIFRIHNAGEADSVVYILNSNGESVNFLVKGSRKLKSRKGPSLELLNKVEVKLTELGNLLLLNDIRLISKISTSAVNIEQINCVQIIAEFISRISYENSEVGLYRNLDNLVESGLTKPYLKTSGLILRSLSLLGFLPKLNVDPVLNESLQGKPKYLRSDAGYSSQPTSISNKSINERLYKSQVFILQKDFTEIAKLDLSEIEQVELLRISKSWAENTLDIELKSWILV